MERGAPPVSPRVVATITTQGKGGEERGAKAGDYKKMDKVVLVR